MQSTTKQVWTTMATMAALAGVTFLCFELTFSQGFVKWIHAPESTFWQTAIVNMSTLVIAGVYLYAIYKKNAAMCLGIGIFYTISFLNDKLVFGAFYPFIQIIQKGSFPELILLLMNYLLSALPLICWMFFSIKDRHTPVRRKVRAKDIGIMLGTMVWLGAMSFFVYKTAVMYDGISWYNMQEGKLYPSAMEMKMTGVACLVIVFVLCLLACIKRIDFILLGVSLHYLYAFFLYSLPTLLLPGIPPAIPLYPYTYLLSGPLDQADMIFGFFYLLSAVPLLIFTFKRRIYQSAKI